MERQPQDMRNDGDNGRRDDRDDEDDGGRDEGMTETTVSEAQKKRRTVGNKFQGRAR